MVLAKILRHELFPGLVDGEIEAGPNAISSGMEPDSRIKTAESVTCNDLAYGLDCSQSSNIAERLVLGVLKGCMRSVAD